jgi:hypothetical protein
MMSGAKQSQLMHSVIVYLFIFFVHPLPDMFLQVLTLYIHIHAQRM